MQQVNFSNSRWFIPEAVGKDAEEISILKKWQKPISEIFERHFGHLVERADPMLLREKLIAIGPPAICLPSNPLPKVLQSQSELYFGLHKNIAMIDGDSEASVQKHLLQPVLLQIYEQAHMKPPKNPFATEALIRQIIGLYVLQPTTGLAQHSIIKIPVFHEEKWKLADYEIERIALSHEVYAFGMKAITANTSPFLFFKGTGNPGQPGSLRELEADFTPGKMVGKALFEEGFESLSKWMETVDDHSLCVCGISLGGCMTLLTTLTFPKKIERAFCYNCPAMLADDVFLWNNDYKVDSTPKILVFLQHGDALSKIGTHWPKGSRVFLIFGEDEHPSFNEAHNSLFLSNTNAVMVEVDPEKERGWETKAVTFTHQVASVIGVPIFEATRWMMGLINDNKEQ